MINPDKTEMLLASQKAEQRNRVAACAGWGCTPSENTGAQLGGVCVLLDSSLSPDAQVLEVARSAFAQLKLVRKLHLFLERSDRTPVTHAVVTSQMDYC